MRQPFRHPRSCPLLPAGFSLDNSLSGTITDNETWSILGSYDFGGPKAYVGYEHVTYSNPSIPLPVGFNDIGGYVLAFVNNAPYTTEDKVLQVYWAGVKYPVNQNFESDGRFLRLQAEQLCHRQAMRAAPTM